MKLTKLIVIATVILLACQLFARRSTYVQKLAAKAEATGQPQKVLNADRSSPAHAFVHLG